MNRINDRTMLFASPVQITSHIDENGLLDNVTYAFWVTYVFWADLKSLIGTWLMICKALRPNGTQIAMNHLTEPPLLTHFRAPVGSYRAGLRKTPVRDLSLTLVHQNRGPECDGEPIRYLPASMASRMLYAALRPSLANID